MASALETSFELDRRWHWLRAERETSKKPDLLALADPGRRRSKRLQDLVDALDLVERRPTLADALTPAERRQLED